MELVRNDAPLQLSTLPTDIIRMLIRKAEVPVDGLRLISLRWNGIVRNYHANRRNFPHLGIIRIDRAKDEEARVTVRPGTRSLDGHFSRICQKWKAEERKDGTIAFYSSPMCIFNITSCWLLPFAPVLMLEGCVAAFGYYITSALLITFTISFLVYLWFNQRPHTRSNCDFLERLFQRCSSIGEMYLVHLNGGTFDNLRQTFGDVPITHLIIYAIRLDAHMRATVVKVARKHRAEKVSICVKYFDERGMRKFFLNITESAKELLIYERFRDECVFGKPRDYWEKRVQSFSDGSFSVKVMNGERQPQCDYHYLKLQIGA